MSPAPRRPAVHLICNAHLDPVWQWRWEEGASEAISTFQTAAKILREHPGLIFCHNEAVLYRWVERLDPVLFREIRRLVRNGRWAIGGGWHLQPDVNLPGIESLIRQIEEGRKYFRDRFQAAPRVAYGFDAFGHGGGMPQVLRRAGYEMYVFMRPRADELDLPADLFLWRGVDGTIIPAYRIAVGLYHTEYDNIGGRLAEGVDLALRLNRDVPVFWGLGDHGGGATREDLAVIDRMTAGEKRVRIIHSTPDRFWAAVRTAAAKAPIVSGDIQRTFPGCYTSLSRIKRAANGSLAGIVQAECLRTATRRMFGQKFPKEKFSGIWRSHLFNDFHDILPGTCVEPAERDALGLYAKAEAEARMLKLEGAAAWAAKQGRRAGIPLTVLNANPALTRVPVEAEFMIDHRPKWSGTWAVRLTDAAGRNVVCQEERPESLLPFNGWRRKIVFMAEPAGAGAAFYGIEPFDNRDTTAGGEEKGPEIPGVHVDPSTGLLDALASAGSNVLEGAIPRLLVVDDTADSWGTGRGSFRDVAGAFEPAGPARTVERGPVRMIYESRWACFGSRAVIQTIVYADWPAAEIRLRVLWSEERRRLVLSFPTAFPADSILCEIPGGAIRRPAGAEIQVHGRWCVAGKGGKDEPAMGLVHDGLHGIEFGDGEFRLHALRGAAYCHERGFALGADRAWKFSDQGVHEIRLAVTAGRNADVLRFLPGLADWIAAPPAVYAHLPFGRPGHKRADGKADPASGKRGPRPFLSISPANIRLLSFRPSADGKAFLLRVQESSGFRTAAKIETAGAPSRPSKAVPIKTRFRPFEMKTFRIDFSGRARETDLLEV
jgi:alpha-mannosidase